MTRLLFALIMLTSVPIARAAYPGEGLYGPEFTFTYDGTVPSHIKAAFLSQLRHHLIEFQTGAAKFSEDWDSEDAIFRSPNGWWFRVSDNPGVLEIQMKPMTVADTRRFKSDIQDAIFASAANVGLRVWDYLGGGHMNFDTKIFGGNVMLARNFVVDFWNHSELSLGILSYDTNNALPLPLYKKEAVDQINEILAKCDAGYYGEGDEAVAQFLAHIDNVLVSVRGQFNEGARGKHHDLNFSHAGRVEIRAVRPQANMDVWLNQIELIESRINNYLKPMTAPLPLKFRVPVKYPLNFADDGTGSAHVPPVNPARAIKSFHKYVTESGLEWPNHRGYIWPPWKEALEAFECEKGLQP